MTANHPAVARRRASPEATQPCFVKPEDIVIGKDVLELVSSAMYVDPLTIYREYVQNAADAIDVARAENMFRRGQAGRVEIEIDNATRTVRIRDNGCGLKWLDFVRRLTALGSSVKRGKDARGFRGVGRLAGLGYAQEIVFRSRALGETLVSEMHWDSRQLKAAFRTLEPEVGVVDVIKKAVSVYRSASKHHPDHFFEVELKGLIRLRGDHLLNPSSIREYLAQVAPVPFAPEFKFGAEIAEILRPALGGEEIEIFIAGQEKPVYRPHRDTFMINENKLASFRELEIFEVPSVDGATCAVGWVLHHEYEGAVPTGALVKGLRLRSGNIQVGDHALLEELFPEPRFNVWSVGEIHVLDRRVIPNGRRDHFEQNVHYHNLINQLTPTAREITKRCRTQSVCRKLLREFELCQATFDANLKLMAQGAITSRKKKMIALAAEQALLQMERIVSKEVLRDVNTPEMEATIKKLRAKLARAMNDKLENESPLARLSPQKRAMYEHFFGLVYDCSTNRTAAKALIDRILLKLT